MMKILIIKLGAIGDVLRTTSFLKGLKEKYKADIDWLTKGSSYDMLENDPLIDNILIIDKDKMNDSYDLVINLDDDKEVCKIASDLEKKRLIGAYIENGKIIYKEDSSAWFDMSLISRFGKKRADELKKENKSTYQDIVSKILDIPFTEPILDISKEKPFAQGFADKNNIKPDKIIIGINTGAGKRWEKKKWPIKYTAQLIDQLNSELNATCILFGGPEEVGRNQKIKELVKTKVVDAGCDNSLMQFASLVDLCRILVTTDSLAMHIGIALKKQVIALFGPTSAAEINIFNRGEKLIAPKECYCCYKKKCGLSGDCMDLISVDDVFKAVKRRIEDA